MQNSQGGMKVPLNGFLNVLRTANGDQKNVAFPLVSMVLKQYLNNDPLDMDSLTGHQTKFFQLHQNFFAQLQGLGTLPANDREFLGRVFSEVGDNLKAGRKPYICAGDQIPSMLRTILKMDDLRLVTRRNKRLKRHARSWIPSVMVSTITKC